MTVEDYLKLPYAVEIRWDSVDQIFVARIAEISECSGHGTSRSQAMEMALDNLRDWIQDAIQTGEKIPEPAPLEELPSGKWVQRVPRRMHGELVALAASDEVSLNQFVVSVLAREIGYRSGVRETRAYELPTSSNPSTALWTEIAAEVAISRAWLIRQDEGEDPLDHSYLERLANKLPAHFKVMDRNPEEYAKEKDHKSWN
jgi:predicted RNase H-like HicB family nuclease